MVKIFERRETMVFKLCYLFYKRSKAILQCKTSIFLLVLAISSFMLLANDYFEYVLSKCNTKSKINDAETTESRKKIPIAINELENVPSKSNTKSMKIRNSDKTESRKEFYPVLQPAANSSCLPLPNLQMPKVDLEECSAHHVLMNDGGRLGNKMCQYMSLYILRHLFGVRVSVPPKMKIYLGQFFRDVSLPARDFKCFNKPTIGIRYSSLYRILHTKSIELKKGEDTNVKQNLLNETYYISNNPCHRDLVTEYRGLVHKLFTFENHIIKEARNEIQNSLRLINRSWQNSTLITVHVRRTDYTKFIMKNYGLTPVDEVYFQRAFNYFRERSKNPVFVVLSDDHGWCRSVLEAGDVVVAGSRAVIDMAMLSLGDHHIISYGTFGFMGAVLGHGTIIHPVDKNSLYTGFRCARSSELQPISRDAS